MNNYYLLNDPSVTLQGLNFRPQRISSLSFKASTFHSRQLKRHCHAFSLIEVVLAIGVVAFALLGIVGLFSSSMKNNRDSSAQQEGFQAARMIISRMQDTNFIPTNSLSALCSPSVTNSYYMYTSNSAIILTNTPNYGLTNGTLYYVQIFLSQNLTSITNAFPIAGGGTTPTSSDWANWPGIPLSVRVYTLPNVSLTSTITKTVPVMTFDMVIPR